MEGSSRRAHTTVYSRGTRSYRAPELIRDSQLKYTNKVDVWAVGCILYELVLCRRAFADDWEVLEHANSGTDCEVIIGAESVPDERKREFILKIIKELLNMDPTRRPRAETLYERFISWGSDNTITTVASAEPHQPPPDAGQIPTVTPRVPGNERRTVANATPEQGASDTKKGPTITIEMNDNVVEQLQGLPPIFPESIPPSDDTSTSAAGIRALSLSDTHTSAPSDSQPERSTSSQGQYPQRQAQAQQRRTEQIRKHQITPTAVCLAKALYDFYPSKPGDLPFRRGDIISVLDCVTQGWWRGSLRGQTGIFPVNYAEILEGSTPAGALGVAKKPERPIASVSHVKALYDFYPSELGELAFRRGDNITVLDSFYKDWWRGSLRGQMGVFPVNYVEILNEATAEELASEAEGTEIPSDGHHIENRLELLDSSVPSLPNYPSLAIPESSLHSDAIQISNITSFGNESGAIKSASFIDVSEFSLDNRPQTRELLAWDVNGHLIIMLLGTRLSDEERKHQKDEDVRQWYELWDIVVDQLVWTTRATRKGHDKSRRLMGPKFAPSGDSLVFHDDHRLYVLGFLTNPSSIQVTDAIDLYATIQPYHATNFTIAPKFSRIAVHETPPDVVPHSLLPRSSPVSGTSLLLQLDQVYVSTGTNPTELHYSRDGRSLHFVYIDSPDGIKGMTLRSYRVREASLKFLSSTYISFGIDGEYDLMCKVRWAEPHIFDGGCLLIWLDGQRNFGRASRSLFGTPKKVIPKRVSHFMAVRPSNSEAHVQPVPHGVSNPVITKPTIHLLPDGRLVDLDLASVIDWPQEWQRNDNVSYDIPYPWGSKWNSKAAALVKGNLVMVSEDGKFYRIRLPYL